MSKEFRHEPESERYVLSVDGERVGVLHYVLGKHTISLVRSFTDPRHRGHGYAGELVDYAANDIETRTDLRVIPQCSYVVSWFDSHPERGALLTRGLAGNTTPTDE